MSNLIDVDGTLYGTTEGGGSCGGKIDGCGTVFKVTRSGKESVLHFFGSGSDGDYPFAPLVDVDGALYGTTGGGGGDNSNPEGTIFRITAAGKENVLHSFTGSDGAVPQAGLTDVNGTLYGTTDGGGASGNGTVFSLSL
jgi:uncharacterized repeat protein (TIGR03803 family)